MNHAESLNKTVGCASHLLFQWREVFFQLLETRRGDVPVAFFRTRDVPSRNPADATPSDGTSLLHIARTELLKTIGCDATETPKIEMRNVSNNCL
jgi:hypothetical protein